MQGEQVSGTRKLLALLGLLAAVLGGFAIGYVITHGFSAPSAPPPPTAPSDHVDSAQAPVYELFNVVIWFFLGLLFLGLAAAAYAVAIATQCLTFDFSQPVWGGLKVRLYVANFFVQFLANFGAAFLLVMIFKPVLLHVGLSDAPAFFIPAMTAFFALPLAKTWFEPWTRLRRVVLRRLAAMGVPPQDINSGILTGISDPERKSSRKLGAIEEDVGMLWITPQAIIYQGDSDAFTIKPGQLLGVDELADKGDTDAYHGVLHVVIHFQEDGAAPRTARLHSDGTLTMRAKAKASRDLAAALEAWRTTPANSTT